MRNLKRILLTLANIFLVITISNSQTISGTWTFSNGSFPLTMLLQDNGTGEFQGMPVKYKTYEGKLFIDDGVQPVIYNYQLTQTSLTLTGGNLQTAITFTRPASGTDSPANQYNIRSNTSSVNPDNPQSSAISGMAGSNGSSGLEGIWEGQQGKLIFYPDGNLFYNGLSYQYSVSGNSVAISGNDGNTAFTYNLVNNQLTLTQNSNSANYTKRTSLKTDIIDPQLVGKWCIMSNNYNSYSGGGSSSEECITLNADGSYIYYYSASRSAYAAGQSAYGGTANQNSDHGLWKTDGITLVSVSKTTGKTTRYLLTKENAQNGDATIVVGGRKFITAYNRPSW
jgi:hypothetical protein